jgi:hypothetical protein
MKAEENKHEGQPDGHTIKTKRRALNQLAIGAIIFLWGILLTLKQVGIIEKSVSTWPFALTAFGILLVVGGIYRLSKPC